MRLILISLIAAVLTACASSGTKFEMSDVDAMRPGITTEQEATSMLGKPTTTTYGPDGSKTLGWVWVQATMGKSTTRSAGLLFDKNGKFVRIISKTNIN